MMNYIRRFKTYCSGREIPSKYSQLFRKELGPVSAFVPEYYAYKIPRECLLGILYCMKEREKGEVWGSTYYERRDCTIVESKGRAHGSGTS